MDCGLEYLMAINSCTKTNLHCGQRNPSGQSKIQSIVILRGRCYWTLQCSFWDLFSSITTSSSWMRSRTLTSLVLSSHKVGSGFSLQLHFSYTTTPSKKSQSQTTISILLGREKSTAKISPAVPSFECYWTVGMFSRQMRPLTKKQLVWLIKMWMIWLGKLNLWMAKSKPISMHLERGPC